MRNFRGIGLEALPHVHEGLLALPDAEAIIGGSHGLRGCSLACNLGVLAGLNHLLLLLLFLNFI